MSLDDLSISNISKGASIADNTEKEAAEWKFSDCLRLHLRDHSIFEESQGNYSRKSSLEEQFDENSSHYSEKENQQIVSLSQDSKGKNVPKQILSQKVATSCTSPARVLRQNNTLQNIPEVEAEETPLNMHAQMPSYLRNTISFSQHSAEISSGSQSQKKKRTSYQKNDRENQLFTSENRNSLTSTVRRLFMPDQQNIGGSTPSSSAGCTPTQKTLWNSQSKEAKPKVDSNLKGKVYHDEIVRKNKTGGGSEQQLSLGQTQGTNVSCGFAAADSVDLSMSSLVNSICLSNARIPNDDGQNYENFHNILAAPNQNERVKLRYYEYLLEEAQISQEHFVHKIAQIIEQEKEAFSPGERITSQLLEGIENQRKRIVSLETEVVSLRGRAAQLSQLVVQYRQQIVKMNEESAETSHEIKLMQDQLSTLTLMLQLGNEYSANSSEQTTQEQNQSNNELASNFIHEKLQELHNTVGQFISNAKHVQANTERIDQLREWLRELMVIGHIESNEQLLHTNQLSQELHEEENIVQSIKLKLERLHEDLAESQTQVEIFQRKEEEMQADIYELKIQKKQTERHAQQEKNRFEDIIQTLRKQVRMLQQQQTQLDKQLQKLKIDKKIHFHEELVHKLKCKFEHFSINTVDIQGTTQENKQEQIQMQQHQHLNSQTEIICDMLKVLDQLELGISIGSDGGMQINDDLLQGINCNHLKNWTSTFIANIQILIQSLIKRQIDKQLLQYPQYTDSQRIQLKKLVYKGEYEEYFEYLFNLLKSHPL